MKNFFLIFLTLVIVFSGLTGCSRSVDLAYPLQDAAKWNYQLITPKLPSGQGGKLVLTNLPAREVNGEKAFPQVIESFYGTKSKASEDLLYYLAEDDEGIYIFVPRPKSENSFSAKYYLVKYPIQEGATWTTTAAIPSKGGDLQATSTVESVDESVTVPAGIFEKCIKIKIVATPAKGDSRLLGESLAQGNIWFAPKIGIVRVIITLPLPMKGGSDIYSAKLESYLH